MYITKCETCDKGWKTQTIAQANTIKTVHDVETSSHYIVVRNLNED